MKKINSKCEFGDTLDFDRILESSDSFRLSQSNKRQKKTKVRNLYHLHAILCHSGTLNSGHYFCYIKENNPADCGNAYDDGNWIKYNDQNVSRVFKHLAFANGQGGYNTSYMYDWDVESESEPQDEEPETNDA